MKKIKMERDKPMKEKTKLRVIQILCIISLLITVFSIQRTYAKYFEQVDTTYATNIRRWIINVNNTNIHRGVELNQIMQPVFVANDHMNSNNTLVPGRKGYFEFLIDYTKVDVAFRFQFDIEQTNATPLEDFEIYGYSIVETDADTGEEIEGEPNLITANNLSEITQVIDPNSTNDLNNNNEKKRLIRVLFRWNDANADTEDADDEDGMNNSEDTQFTGEVNTAEGADGLHKILKYKVKITFTQTVRTYES